MQDAMVELIGLADILCNLVWGDAKEELARLEVPSLHVSRKGYEALGILRASWCKFHAVVQYMGCWIWAGELHIAHRCLLPTHLRILLLSLNKKDSIGFLILPLAQYPVRV